MANLDKTFDVLVVGSGPAGSTAAHELTRRGMEVLLLEAGRNITPDDFVPPKPSKPRDMSIDLVGRAKSTLSGQYVQMRRAMFKEQTSPFLVNDFKHPYTTGGDPFLWIRGRQLGGRMHAYGRMLLRASDHEFKAASRDGHGDDWPISYADLEPYYDDVERFNGLYGTTENLPQLPDGQYRGTSPLSSSEQEFKTSVEARWPERHVIPWRFAAPNLGRVPLGIATALKTGRLTLRTDAIVTRITVDPSTGRADGAIFIDRLTKRETKVHANAVMLCASGIESVRLLLNSATTRHPDGLGNSSGQLGRYFMDQTPSLLFGSDMTRTGMELPPDPAPADPYYAPVGGIYVPRWENLDSITRPEFARGWAIQGTIGRLPVPDDSPSAVGLMGFGEMLPNANNRITLARHRKDAWGIPVPRIDIRISDNERAMMRAQMAGLREMAETAGYRVNFVGSTVGLDSKKIWPDADPFSRLVFKLGFRLSLAMGAAIHECGGARMGSDPATSVLNEHNQVWDIPNLFVTDGASYTSNAVVGPALTIMALTARACDHLASETATGAL
ncbi:GMC family oxidoreductase [Demequina capsici]|uniref:GMC family oxidoreductase n=1 Tax=Demequina capsici TaxID=3075620 RepID=A0AA96J6Q2_9MICO|nr:GMC family oxidoreductase [Demequina sp. OYTSA14]WNM23580.1 GMC family oxidoreductase [Demequina sp. OYTSA14]